MKSTTLLILAIFSFGLNSVEQGYAAASSTQATVRDLSIRPIVVVQGSSTLVTQDYIVTVSINCPEGNVTCDDVTYYGVNKHNGDSLELQGRTVHSICADGITPCQFLGYEFFNGSYRYFVTHQNTLWVSQNGQPILEQSGYWE